MQFWELEKLFVTAIIDHRVNPWIIYSDTKQRREEQDEDECK